MCSLLGPSAQALLGHGSPLICRSKTVQFICQYRRRRVKVEGSMASSTVITAWSEWPPFPGLHDQPAVMLAMWPLVKVRSMIDGLFPLDEKCVSSLTVFCRQKPNFSVQSTRNLAGPLLFHRSALLSDRSLYHALWWLLNSPVIRQSLSGVWLVRNCSVSFVVGEYMLTISTLLLLPVIFRKLLEFPRCRMILGLRPRAFRTYVTHFGDVREV